MTTTRTLVLLSVLLAAPVAMAQTGGRQQYISDEITVSIREQPRNDATVTGSLKSGARVTLLESLGAESFARIRTSDGREGWITARFLTSQPVARERYLQAKQELDAGKLRIQNLERELTDAQQQLAKLKPASELQRDNERLRSELSAATDASGEISRRYDLERAKRRTLITGAGLIGGGILLGLLLPWIGSGRKRKRYGDF